MIYKSTTGNVENGADPKSTDLTLNTEAICEYKNNLYNDKGALQWHTVSFFHVQPLAFSVYLYDLLPLILPCSSAVVSPRWRHQMETFSALLAICVDNSPVSGEFPSRRPVTRSFDVSFDMRLNKRLRKQSWGWWLETPSCSLWRHCNA